MTDRSRDLLRRLVEWDTGWMGEYRGLDLETIIHDARAMLAEPQRMAVDEETGPPPVRHEQPVILRTVYEALERERDMLVAALNRIHDARPTRQEAEAMLREFEGVAQLFAQPVVSRSQQDERLRRYWAIYASLLAALTGEPHA